MARDTWIDLDGRRLFARVWDAPGDRAPVVLLHDSLGCVELWRDFPARLAEHVGRTVVAYDRLGFGRSDPHPDALTPAFIADEGATVVPAVCDALDVGRFVAFGHSVGGGMAIKAAAASPQRCVAVVTEAAQAFVEDRTTAGIREADAGLRTPAGLERLARYHGEKAPWVLDAWVHTWLDPAFADWSLDAALPRVTSPVLAIHGAQDEYGSPEHPERIAGRTAGPARLELLEGIHHVPHREDESAVLALVAPFLAPLD